VPFEDGSLEVFVARSPGAATAEPQAFMLEFTGNGSRADDMTGWVASRWGERPIEVWVMNYPGYGRSTGPARLKSLAPAGLAVYDALAKVAAGRPIFVAGNSMGTTVALHVATQRPVAGMILQSPPPLRQIVLRDHGWWNLWLLAGPVALGVPSSLDSITQAALVHAPAVFITADSDRLVRPEMQRRVIDAYAGPKRTIVLVGKDHNDSLDKRDELRQFSAALDWLMSLAKSTATRT
jgi:pimeloyl-ACP methyl ester carboxylesterase